MIRQKSVDSVCPSLLSDVGAAQECNVGMSRAQRADRALRLADTYSELLGVARSGDIALAEGRGLIATDAIFSEVIRMVVSQCVEEGALLQLLREQLIGRLNPPSQGFAATASTSVHRRSPDSPRSRAHISSIERRLEDSQRECSALKKECSRLARLNGLLAAQRVHESVLHRSTSLATSSAHARDAMELRASVLSAASDVALALKRVKCEMEGEVEAYLSLKAKDRAVDVTTQTTDEGFIGAFYASATA